MVELCLMASHGYPPGLGVGFHQEHASTRVSDDFHHFLPHQGLKQDLVDPLSFSLSGQQKEWRSAGGFSDSNHSFRFDSTYRRPVAVDFQDTSPDSVVLGVGINVERCARHEKILKLLMSGSIEEEDPLLNLSMLYDLTGPQSTMADLPQQPFASHFKGFSDDGQTMLNLIYPTRGLYFNEPFLDLVGDRSSSPEKMYYPDGQLPYSYTNTDMVDIHSVISDFHSLKNPNKSSKQTMLVPYFERRRKANASTNASKLATEKVKSLKSHDKVKEKTARKKKTTGNRTGNERDAYCNSSLHACESLLSIIMDRKQQGTNTILSLKRSGPQLPQLLTQFSASIAGTGIAVVLSVLCRVACTRVPFCASKLLSTGVGLGLVWLSWAVHRLRDTVISISKTSAKTDKKEEEMMNHLDRNLKDIYFRAVALIAVVVLKVA